jgi:uncharacterized protein with HEPN domain
MKRSPAAFLWDIQQACVLLHGYSGLNHREIWRVLYENLPELHAAVTALVHEVDPPASS